MSKRILLVGGGSGGHVFPLIAVAESLRKINPTIELMMLGSGIFLDRAAEAINLPHKKIQAGKIRRYFSLWTVLAPFQALIGFVQSLWILFWYMPDLIFTKGGYVSIMPALAAKLYFIPIYTHESDSIPGLANKFIANLSKKVFTSFEFSSKFFKSEKTILVGNPIRTELLKGDRDSALKQFNFRADKKTVLVIGGSQGAKRINDAISESLILLVQEFQIIHQCGDSQYKVVKAVVDEYMREGAQSYGPLIRTNYRNYPFLNTEDLRMAYAAADVIISRGGASLFEIAALGKPAIIIPINKSTNNHQLQNALEFEKYGGVIIEESNITSHILINEIKNLLEPSHYQLISNQIRSFAKLEAADKIASILLE
jgi:UDP-N-acetylglucosamine--N-acetylmuramyl-(pentapeptide) pyrophosphoryl-undecaprenol N-acetylglucosamine transferase